MKINSFEFTPRWSWGLVIDELVSSLGKSAVIQRVFCDVPSEAASGASDVHLFQNITLFKRFALREYEKTISRLGGNRSFMDQPENIWKNHMAKCFAIIATNKYLYDVARKANPNTHLIPNGITLDTWKPRPFTVGFCANISIPEYANYKGYDIVLAACELAGVEIRTATFGDKQTPHDEMRERFYYLIDCLVHPTLGEGCSNTIMEAVACGVPVITTRCAGYHGETMIDMHNVVFCERTAESIAEKITALKEDKPLRECLSSNAREYARAHHDIKIIAEKYRRLFQDCYDSNEEQRKNTEKIRVRVTSQRAIVYDHVKRFYGEEFEMLSDDFSLWFNNVEKVLKEK